MASRKLPNKNNMLKIVDVGKRIGLSKDDLILFGDYKAKIKAGSKRKKQGNLILVTAISATSVGEGKTSLTIGLGDAFKRLGEKVIITLREPSSGRIFSTKGGATGGGRAMIVPTDEINLHFTGDFHAITLANNLIAAAVDNHIYYGNSLDIQKVLFKRCLDVNDRALRNVDLGSRKESFSMTSASEVMAIFCLATSIDDLRERLGNIVVGINSIGDFVYVRDLKIVGSLVAILKDAFLPNLVQTKENTPAIVHGGVLANFAQGSNSLVSTNFALSHANYIISEAGYGADMGAERFFDITCRTGKIKPYVVVLSATIKSLKFHGGISKEDVALENVDALIKGFANLDRHYVNLKKFGVTVIVALNRFENDSDSEIDYFKKHCEKMKYSYCVVSPYLDGGEGTVELAKMIMKIKKSKFKTFYRLEDSINTKIKKVCKNLYGASKIKYSELAKEKIKILNSKNLSYLPICVAKTQYSFSDDKSKIEILDNFTVTVKDIYLYNGAGFLVILLGDIITILGLPRKPNFEDIDFVDDEIINLV